MSPPTDDTPQIWTDGPVKTAAKTVGLTAAGIAVVGVAAPLLAGTAAVVAGGVSAGLLIAGGVNSLNYLALRKNKPAAAAEVQVPAEQFRDDLAARRQAKAAAAAEAASIQTPSSSPRPR